MIQLWTIIFIILLALAFGLTVWLDKAEQKEQAQKRAAYAQRDKHKG